MIFKTKQNKANTHEHNEFTQLTTPPQRVVVAAAGIACVVIFALLLVSGGYPSRNRRSKYTLRGI